MFVNFSHPLGHLVCKLLSLELQEELSRTGRSREVLELGQVQSELFGNPTFP